MPNTCQCTLRIIGDPDDVELCLESISSPRSGVDDQQLFDFDRVIPMGPDLRAELEAPSASPLDAFGKLTAVTLLWGTKWNASGVTIDRKPDGSGACIEFWTAWTPPLPVIETLADQFRSLEFDLTYFDLQAPIAGRLRRDPADGVWRSIEANGDHGFCAAAYEAKSWMMWDQDQEAGPIAGQPEAADLDAAIDPSDVPARSRPN
jgi:hypothetical protein